MIKKINKISRLGLLFSAYAWDNTLPVFKKINLIYGWNGTGKTTLSRLFDAIGEASETDVEYEIEDENGAKYKQGESFKKIRVFNSDYVRKNVQVLEGRTSAISILLGAENKELVAQIEGDKKLLYGDPGNPSNKGKRWSYDEKTKERTKLSNARDSLFTSVAKAIGAAIGGNALRDYRKPQAERDFASLTEKAELEDQDLQEASAVLKQETLPPLTKVPVPSVTIGRDSPPVHLATALSGISDQAENLLKKTVDAAIIERLSENPDLATWVERGVALHQKYESRVCEYCLQVIPVNRLEQLSRHFSEADRALKEETDVLTRVLEEARKAIESVTIPDKARFYAELQADVDLLAADMETAKRKLLERIASAVDTISRKKSQTTESVPFGERLDATGIVTALDAINALIANHNSKTANFEKIRKEATGKLKAHYLSTIFDQVRESDATLDRLGTEIDNLEREVAEIAGRVSENTAKVSSEHKACELINDKLCTFLGHKELQFVPIEKGPDGATGYQIMRGSKQAVHLSEGEKTAIAFVYFVVHLTDSEFDAPDGVVVIDDPISSLDSGSLYQAFSFLKNAVKDAGQVFILTHSFDFLRLLLNWMRHSVGSAEYYMIKNNFSDGQRNAYICKLDKELTQHESEYHYLFKLLKQLRDAQDDSLAMAYPIPNIARKVWDTFLMFSVPTGESPYKKMEALKKDGYDPQKLDAIYKFTNDQSHITGAGFDPALVPEAKKVVKELFEMMDAILPRHFKIIDQATN